MRNVLTHWINVDSEAAKKALRVASINEDKRVQLLKLFN
jgi:hypothetical protein